MSFYLYFFIFWNHYDLFQFFMNDGLYIGKSLFLFEFLYLFFQGLNLEEKILLLWGLGYNGHFFIEL